MTNLTNVQKLEEYRQEFKENEIKRREIIKRNKEVLAKIIKLQDEILNQK